MDMDWCPDSGPILGTHRKTVGLIARLLTVLIGTLTGLTQFAPQVWEFPKLLGPTVEVLV